MKLLRAFIAGAFLLTFGGLSVAGDFSMNPSVAPINSTQGSFNDIFGITFLGASNVIYTSGSGLAAGSTFIDNGALTATGIKSNENDIIPIGTSGLGLKWELGAVFDGLTGKNTTITGTVVNFTFDPGVGTITLYASSVINNQSSNPASIADGVAVGTLKVIAGKGTFDFDGDILDGSVDLLLRFTSVLPGFWDHLGTPITVGTDIFLALTDSNNNEQIASQTVLNNFSSFFGETALNNGPQNFMVSNDGSVDFGLAVPEPASMLLLGSGLLGVAGFLRRKRK